jgi:peptidoglycan hydrolase-like protein with peptidoglycan-binding domain
MVAMLAMAGQASAAPLPTLTPGARGTDVGIMQRLLSYGGNPVAITALIGPTTEELIKDYQTRHGLTADGIVGPATWHSLQPVLSPESSGPAVKALQIALNEKHGYDLPVTGYYGPQTQAAVAAFQRHMGLTADGVAGHITWDALIGHFAEVPASGTGFYRCFDATSTWATSNTVATLELVAERWHDAGYGVRIGVNDISEPHGGYFWPHESHRSGQDVDLRLMRNDGVEAALQSWRDPAYSRALTQRLVDMLWATGEVDFILFNDPNVIGVKPWAGHDDHLHVHFKR